MGKDKRLSLKVSKIIAECCLEFNISPSKLLSRERWVPLTFARQKAMYRCRKELKLSYPVIGEYFKRDHSSIISAVKSWEKKKKRLA